MTRRVHRVGIEEHKYQDSVPPDVGVAPPVVYRANENRDVARLASSTLRFAHFVDPVEFHCAEPEQDADAARHAIAVHVPRLLLAPLHGPYDSAGVQADDVKCVAYGCDEYCEEALVQSLVVLLHLYPASR